MMVYLKIRLNTLRCVKTENNGTPLLLVNSLYTYLYVSDVDLLAIRRFPSEIIKII